MKSLNITKKKLQETRKYRMAIAILVVLVLFLISGYPESLILKIILSVVLGLWVTYGTELIIFKNTRIDSTIENLKIQRISILEEEYNAAVKKIPGLEIETISVEEDPFLYAVCFKVSEGVFKALTIIVPSPEARKNYIGSDVLLESFKGLKKEVVTTKSHEIILSFLPVSDKVQVLQTFRSSYEPLEVEVNYPYIKY